MQQYNSSSKVNIAILRGERPIELKQWVLCQLCLYNQNCAFSKEDAVKEKCSAVVTKSNSRASWIARSPKGDYRILTQNIVLKTSHAQTSLSTVSPCFVLGFEVKYSMNPSTAAEHS